MQYILAIVGIACLRYILYFACQKGAIFGFWQNVINAVYSKSEAISNVIGGCYVCTSFWFSYAAMGVFYAIYGAPFNNFFINAFIFVNSASIATVLALLIKGIIERVKGDENNIKYN